MPTMVNIPIVSVTLLEDRAQVTRQATLDLPAGVARLALDAVSPIIADKTLIGRIRDGGARMVDTRVVRRKVVSPIDEPSVDEPAVDSHDSASPADGAASNRVEALERMRDDLTEQLYALQAQQQAAEEQCALLDQLAAMSLDELAIDASWGGSPSPEASTQLGQLDERRRTLRAEIVAGARHLTHMQGRLRRLALRIQTLSTPSTEIAASVELDVLVDQAGPVQLTVEYVVPGACWRPHHTAELLGDDEIRFSTDASVWQNCGEDWSDVELSFSTERPSLGAEPPALSTDQLHVQRKSPVLHVQARDRSVQHASKGAATASELPGIDDGGEVQLLRALARGSVPSNGRPYRVPLSTFTAPCTRRSICYPELVRSVLCETTQANGSERPILAGPVDLIRKSGLCGRTTILFIGPRERFALGWGPEAELRVQRDEQIKIDDASILSSWAVQSHLIELRLSNLGPSEQRVTVRERIPVSEIEKVKIEPDPKRTTGGKEPDSDGFLQWQLTIAPHGTEDLALGYTLKKHNDVVGI